MEEAVQGKKSRNRKKKEKMTSKGPLRIRWEKHCSRHNGGKDCRKLADGLNR